MIRKNDHLIKMIDFRNRLFYLQWGEKIIRNVHNHDSENIISALKDSKEDLLQLEGISEALLTGIIDGLTNNDWDKAIYEFGRSSRKKYNFYIGPMTAMQGMDLSLGFIFLRKVNQSEEIVCKVEKISDEIGFRLFGMPCNFFGRHVEFYDLLLAEGPFAESGGKYIALFTPFYFDGWKNREKQLSVRRSILFHNVVKKRFETLTYPFSDALEIRGRELAWLQATPEEIDRAIILWLTLHELIHGSGPLPLFTSSSTKLSLGLKYAGLEEARVDMTTWLILKTCEDLFGQDAKIACDLILCERLLRSARLGLWNDLDKGWIGRSSDGEQGAIWISLLIQTGALTFSNDGTKIIGDDLLIQSSLESFLADLYNCETKAARLEGNEQKEYLLNFAKLTRDKLFSRPDGTWGYPREVIKFFLFYNDLPTHIHLRFTSDMGECL
jgi:hypothetical protein